MTALTHTGKLAKFCLGTLLATTALCSSLSAFGADRLTNPQPIKNWSGLYYGVHAGGLVAEGNSLEYNGNWDYSEYGKSEWAGMAGGQIGINRQIGNFVYGAEADFSFTSFAYDQAFDGGLAVNTAKWDWLATIRARAGLAVGNSMFYTTAGVAFVQADYRFGYLPPSTSITVASGVYTGIAAGAGFEYAIDPNWSLRAEYLYVGLPDKIVDTDYGVFSSSAHIARIALNYSLGETEFAQGYEAPATAGNWQGFYVGGNIAGLLGKSTALEYSGPHDYGEYSINELAAAGGLQAGYNWQNGHTVFGIEADINLSNFDNRHTLDGGSTTNQAEWDWFSTVRARAGIAAGNTLAYVTAGVAIVDADYEFHDTVYSDPRQVGLAIGAGVEVALDNRWSARLEYLYVGLPEELIPDFGGDTGSFVSSAHMARASVNYALGDGFSPGSGTALPDTINWSGIYGGVVGGAMMASASTMEYSGPWDLGTYSLTDWAGTIGGVVGVNKQIGNFVYGLEGDISWTSFDQAHLFSGGSSRNAASMDWLATVRARVGLAAGSSMIYATGGLAIADMHHEFDDNPNPEVVINETVVGLAVGAGFEHDFGNGWSGRLEAMHVALPSIVDTTYDTTDYPMNFTTTSNIARFSIVKRM